MSFQTIIDNATSINVNYFPISSVVVSRSNRIKTAEKGPALYRFEVNVNRPFVFNAANRALLQNLQQKNRTTEEEIKLSNNANMSYIQAYAGGLTNAQIADLRIDSFSGNTLTIDTSLTSGIVGGTSLFTVGDYIQPSSSRYTYQVTQAVVGTDISLGLVNVSVHRNIFTSSSDGGTNITSPGTNGVRVGTTCTFNVKCLDMPTYTLVPGNLFQFDGPFTFVEIIL